MYGGNSRPQLSHISRLGFHLHQLQHPPELMEKMGWVDSV